MSCLLWHGADAFLLPHGHFEQAAALVPSVGHPMNSSPQATTTRMLAVVDPEVSSFLLAEESWRQYASLVVIAGVLIDILLGSPLANSLLKPMRGDEVNKEEEDDARVQTNRSKERIDSEAVARAAIARAQGVLELRKFLDESKTDWDRFEEMKRKLDSQMEGLDADLEQREQSLAKRRGLD